MIEQNWFRQGNSIFFLDHGMVKHVRFIIPYQGLNIVQAKRRLRDWHHTVRQQRAIISFLKFQKVIKWT